MDQRRPSFGVGSKGEREGARLRQSSGPDLGSVTPENGFL